MTLARISLISAAVALALGLLPSEAAAEWKGKGEVGAVMARGNSDADTVNIKLDMSRELDRWKHYKFSDRSYWFGGLRYEDDRFSGFDYQASVTTGVGRKFIDTDTTKFSGQVGVGYKQLKPALLGRTESEAIVAGELKFEHALTETTKIIDKFVVEAGSSNTFVANDLALQVKMSDKFSLSAGIGVRYNSDPPGGLKTTDTLTTLNLVYGF
jgi:putative salt-induced outer membrane protein